MTEKRFTIEPTMIRECIVDNTTGEQLDTFDYTERLCAKLNELAEENKEFKAMCEEYRKLSIQYKQKYDEKISDNTFLEEENKELKAENEQLKQAKKFFEEILFNVIYATSDYQRLLLNKEMLEVIDECDSLDELRERANYGIEEFKEEHKWLE